MSQYYNQFYPGYQFPRFSNKSEYGTPSNQLLNLNQNYTRPIPSSKAVNPTPGIVPNYPQYFANQPGNYGNFDYAQYYNYFYGSTAGGGFPCQIPPGFNFFGTFEQTGRQTPALFNIPHMRVSLSCPGIMVQVIVTMFYFVLMSMIYLITILDNFISSFFEKLNFLFVVRFQSLVLV